MSRRNMSTSDLLHRVLTHINSGIRIRSTLTLIVIAFIILLAFLIHRSNKEFDKEYQEYGYTGFFDKIHYDEWTGEVIPKAQIDTYNNRYKFITNSYGTVFFFEIKSKVDDYEKLQGPYAFIDEEKLDEVNYICTVLFDYYFEIGYSIEPIESDEHLYRVHLKNFTANGTKYDDYAFCSSDGLRYIVKCLVKGIYREQNHLEPAYDFGY